MEFKIDNSNENSIFNITLSDSEDGIFIYDVLFRPERACSPSKITVEFNIPYIDAFSLWNSQCGLERNVLPDWRPQHQISRSRLASGVPIQSVKRRLKSAAVLRKLTRAVCAEYRFLPVR